MKKRQFFHLGLLCLILTFSNNLSANAMTGFPVNSAANVFFNGGLDITIQGLTSNPVEVSFPNQREGSLITLMIFTITGELIYQEATLETNLDYSTLHLPEGEKTLQIEVGSETFSIVFD